MARLAEHPPTRINITLYGAGNETYSPGGRSGMFDRVDRAITLLRQAGILVKLNCSLTPHNACDLERIVLCRERDLILEVNTYMFPAAPRPAMVGRNDRFTPAETAHYHMGANARSVVRRTSPLPAEHPARHRPPRLDEDWCVPAGHDLLPRGQRRSG
ncbi:MAG: hypothetical protein ACLUEK_11035 [Oscillospiraceae bacterium]